MGAVSVLMTGSCLNVKVKDDDGALSPKYLLIHLWCSKDEPKIHCYFRLASSYHTDFLLPYILKEEFNSANLQS